MEIKKSEEYTLVIPTENTVNEFFKIFKENQSNFEKEHVIIDFSEKINMNIEEIMLFLELSLTRKKAGTSFVLISNGINIDEISDEINVVPTLKEALDILEMDAIERDLGF